MCIRYNNETVKLLANYTTDMTIREQQQPSAVSISQARKQEKFWGGRFHLKWN